MDPIGIHAIRILVLVWNTKILLCIYIGIVFSDGEGWAEQRRFTLRTLRDFGFGKKGMEAMIMEEVTDIIDWLKKGVGKPISVNRKFSLAVLNSLWSILTSERYDHDDPRLTNILDTVQE